MKVLNVGGNNKEIPIPLFYSGWEHHILDIDSNCNPDICCDAVTLKDNVQAYNQYDSVYCSHNLEHYYKHKVADVLTGFYKALTDNGFCYIIVPHLLNVMRRVVAYNMEFTDILYTLDDKVTPITPHDVIFGWGKQIEQSNCDFFAHKCGYTPKMLSDAMINAGFPYVYIGEIDLSILALAFKKLPEEGKIDLILNSGKR